MLKNSILRVLLLITFSVSILLGNIASAATVQIDTSSSIIRTSGGFAGVGYGDLSVSGRFDVTVVEPRLIIGTLSFSNFDIVVNPEIRSPTTTITNLTFTSAGYDGLNFSNSLACLFDLGAICPQGGITGTYDGTNFSLTGNYFSGIADDYSYEIILNATVVPLPAAAWLFVSGIVFMFGINKRKNNKQA